jgi:hypothetical protein
MGYKLWTTNELLTSSDVNTYLMKQAVISTTSGSKPTPPVDGMLVWETDTENYVSYNASLATWVYVGKMLTGTYTSTLTAVTTNPTLGTGGSANGRYTLFGGKFCVLRGTVAFGTASTNAGSGQYLIALPFAASSAITTGVPFVGSGVVRCAGGLNVTTCFIASGSSNLAMLTTGGNNVASGAPGAWTANDYLSFTITYEMA